MGRLLHRAWGQLLRIRTRLVVINVVTVLVPIVGLEWARSFERQLLVLLEQDLRNQVQILRTLLEHDLDERGRPQLTRLATALVPAAKRTRTRMRILDRQGHVVADSHVQGAPEGPEPAVPRIPYGEAQPPRRRHRRPSTNPGSVAERVEVLAARAGRLGTATRIHQRIKRAYLFLAMPVMHKRRVAGIVYATRSTVPALLAMHQLRRQLVVVLGVALLFTAALTLFLAATISRPLTRLTRAAKQLASGDRSVRLRSGGRDEIGELSRALEALVRQLDGRVQYIAELAANVSHEFKTPLSSIRGAAELLAEGAAEDPAARERFLRNILADTERLSRLVSRILDLSRIEASLQERERFELLELVHEVLAGFVPRHPIALDSEVSRLELLGHRAHLGAALGALLENAVHFSPPDVPVRLLVRHDGDCASLTVVDQGPGISAANQKKVFDRFFTTEAERGGSGIGLAIVAAVVAAHGGRISVTSEPGRGARFEMTLPIAR